MRGNRTVVKVAFLGLWQSTSGRWDGGGHREKRSLEASLAPAIVSAGLLRRGPAIAARLLLLHSQFVQALLPR